MGRQSFGEHKLVENIELLFFYRHHKVEYETALQTQLDESIYARANDSYMRSLASAKDNLRQMPNLSYCFYHVPHEQRLVDLLRKKSIPMVFLLRDPRDVVISLTHHIMRERDSKKHRTLAAIATDEDRYLAVIHGYFGRETPYFPLLPIAYLFERYERWLMESDVLILRYEDIIGPRGGGDQIKQYEAYAQFVRHVGLDISEDRIQSIADNIYNESAAFFIKGQIGQWRDKFTPLIENEFQRQMGKTLHLWLN